MRCAELLGELADERLGGVGGEAAGIAGGVEDVEEKLGEPLTVFGGGGSFVEGGISTEDSKPERVSS